MKSGANFIEQNQINKSFKEGMTAKEISTVMGINLAHVETYKPKKAVKSEPKK